VWDVSSGRCLRTLTGHTDDARRRRPVKTRVDRSSTPRGAQVICVAVLPNGGVVSGSRDETLKVWDVSSGRCLHTLSGHTNQARRRRPVEQRVDRSSTVRRAQVNCVVALSNGHLVSGSVDSTLKVWDVSSGRCLHTLSAHSNVRRRRPVEPRG
jgi:F-box/WD-40 domain protein 7